MTKKGFCPVCGGGPTQPLEVRSKGIRTTMVCDVCGNWPLIIRYEGAGERPDRKPDKLRGAE